MAQIFYVFYTSVCIMTIIKSGIQLPQYGNPQMLNYESMVSDKSTTDNVFGINLPTVNIARGAEEKETVRPTANVKEECKCSDVYDPVCASNNKSYYNLCLMQCELGTGPDVAVMNLGNCIPFML